MSAGKHPGGERAELVEHAVDVVGEPLEQLACAGRAAGHHLLGELEPDAQRDQPLLAAVVEVALDPPALVVGRREDACPRGPQLAAELSTRSASRSFSSQTSA